MSLTPASLAAASSNSNFKKAFLNSPGIEADFCIGRSKPQSVPVRAEWRAGPHMHGFMQKKGLHGLGSPQTALSGKKTAHLERRCSLASNGEHALNRPVVRSRTDSDLRLAPDRVKIIAAGSSPASSLSLSPSRQSETNSTLDSLSICSSPLIQRSPAGSFSLDSSPRSISSDFLRAPSEAGDSACPSESGSPAIGARKAPSEASSPLILPSISSPKLQLSPMGLPPSALTFVIEVEPIENS